MYENIETNKLVGAKVEKILINSEYLMFVTDKGSFGFTVEGDCCSHSYFYNFIGVKRLLENGAIKAFEEVKDMPHPPKKKDDYGDVTAAYGYRITTEDKEHGEVSSVLSFRNDNNGYYGGWMEVCEKIPDDVPEIKKDWIYNPLDIKQ